MHSTLRGAVPPYIGVDLTDRYSRGCRDNDVCGLTRREDDKLTASFWFWRWDPAPKMLDVDAIVQELAATHAAMLDGPQGLANSAARLRDCERISNAVGKTADSRPQLSAPFAGFIHSSLDLFAALTKAGTVVGPPGFTGGVSEVYPGHIWQVLANRHLPRKNTDEGRLVRRSILESLGVIGLPELPTHDQNDACIAAVMAAAADGKVTGVAVRGIGIPLTIDPSGTLREGLMAIPDLSAVALARVSDVLDRKPAPRVAAPKSEAVESLRPGDGTTGAERHSSQAEAYPRTNWRLASVMVVVIAALGTMALVMRPVTPPDSGSPASVASNGSPPSQQRVPMPTTSRRHVRIVSLAHSVTTGKDITLVAQAEPSSMCTVSYFSPSGNPSNAAGLAAKLTSAAGAVTWTWRIGSSTAAGTAKVKVACGLESAEGRFVVRGMTPR